MTLGLRFKLHKNIRIKLQRLLEFENTVSLHFESWSPYALGLVMDFQPNMYTFNCISGYISNMKLS